MIEPIIVLEGGGLRVSMPIFGKEGNPYPDEQPQIYSFKLDPETPGPGWQPRLTKNQFMKLLSDLKSIKIRGTFTPDGTTYLDNVFLETARKLPDRGPPDGGVEQCECPKGHAGLSCENCAEGFMRAKCDGADQFEKCVPCTAGQKCGC
jgi:coxsackievirus/adenovirus receptor